MAARVTREALSEVTFKTREGRERAGQLEWGKEAPCREKSIDKGPEAGLCLAYLRRRQQSSGHENEWREVELVGVTFLRALQPCASVTGSA